MREETCRLERTSSDMIGGLSGPQSATSPGPAYSPNFAAIHAQSRCSSFSVQRRDTSGVEGGSIAPGPGLYNPSDKVLSTKRDYTSGGGFLADDRTKYLTELDPSSLTPVTNNSPGPAYNPSWIAVQSKPQGGVIGTSKRFYFGPNRNG